MRLAIHIHSMERGGAERSVAQLVTELSQRGHEVVLLTQQPPHPGDYPIPETVRRYCTGAKGSRPAPLRAFRRLSQLRRIVRREKVDILVGFMTTSSIYAVLAMLGSAVPVVCCERVNPEGQPLSRWNRWLRNWCLPRAVRVICQTADAARWYARQIPGTDPLVIPNAVRYPLPQLQPIVQPSDHVPEHTFLVLAVGRLDPLKGFDLLIQAFERLLAAGYQMTLAIAGEGPERVALEGQCRAAGLEHSVLLLGNVGNLSDWYHRADLFAMASRTEGFPNVLLEAMAHDCAVVATDCNFGPRIIIKDGVTGRLVKEQTAEALAAAIGELADDPATRHRLAAAAGSIRHEYAPRQIVDRWEATLAGLIS